MDQRNFTLCSGNREALILQAGRPVASIHGDTLRRSVKGSRHLLRTPVPAWAFHVEVLALAQQAGATRVQVSDVENGVIYCASLRQFDGLTPFDRGYGLQVALPLAAFAQKTNSGSARLEPVQLSLFGGR